MLTGNISLLLSHQVHNAHDLEHVMELGSKNRSVGATLMNVDSSRSHSIFSIDIEMMESGEDGREKLRAGRLNLVDLAGSERQSKTGSTGNGGREGERGGEGGRRSMSAHSMGSWLHQVYNTQ